MHLHKRTFIALYLLYFSTFWLGAKDTLKLHKEWTKVSALYDLPYGFIEYPPFRSFSAANSQKLAKEFNHLLRSKDNTIRTIKVLLRKHGLSEHFVAIPFIESRFNPNAVSKKHAVGVWQLIATTAQMLSLKIANVYDERKDIVASSKAAIAYLKYLKKRFGKWYLAILAYNAGEGRIASIVAQTGSDAQSVLRHPKLPKESRNYLYAILLASMLQRGVDSFEGYGAVVLVRVEPKFGQTLQDVASLLGIDKEELKRYNPHISTNLIHAGIKDFYIPKDLVYKYYLASRSKGYLCKHAILYRVRLGDTLEKIAKKYNTTKQKIKFCMSESREYLIVGEFIKVPQ